MPTRIARCRIAPWLLSGLLFGAVTAHAQPVASTDTMLLPGSAAELARAAGLAENPGRRRVLIEVVRRLHHVPDDAGSAREQAAVAAWFEAPTGSPDAVPLPLGPAMWQRVLGRDLPPAGLARRIVTSRAAACFYHGMVALDAGTQTWIAARGNRLARFSGPLAPAFAVFARSLRVAAGRVIVPGGSDAEALWSEILDATPDEADEFLERLLTRDGGRFAWFYDTVAQLPPPMQRHVLGVDLADPEARLSRVRALARVFAHVGPGWTLAERPFWRPLADPALLLEELAASPDGRLALAATAPVWEGLLGSTEVIDAAWLARRVFLDDPARQRDRLELVLFVQRRLARHPQVEADHLRAWARLFARMPMLGLVLERAGTDAPDLAEPLGEVALSLARRGPVALAGFQAALALLERGRLAGAIGADAADRAVAGLAAIPLEDAPPWHPAVAAWLRGTWTASADRHAGDDSPADLDEAVIQSLAGPPPASAAGRLRVDWEGDTYEVDPVGSLRARIEAVRRSQGAVPLGMAVAFSDAVGALGAGRPPAVPPAVAAIERIVPALVAASLDGGSGEDRLLDTLARTRTRLAGLGPRPAAKAIVRTGRALGPAADRLLAASLVAMVYAAALPADQTELLSARVHRRHDLGVGLRQGEARARTPWLLAEPVSGSGVPWHLRGSLLSLDVALAPERLRRISDEPPAPRLPAGDRLAFGRSAALMPAAHLDDAQLTTLAEAVAAGARRLAALAGDGSSLDEVARDAGVSAWRQAAWRWARVHAPEEKPSLSLTELLRLGLATTATSDALDAWGTSFMPVTGELATRLPRPRPWEDVTGHDGSGRLAAQLADLPIAIGLRLRARRLPAALTPGVLEAATADLVDRVDAPHPDDWRALVAIVPRLLDERFDDYVAALTAGGPLRPMAPAGDSR